MTKLTLINKFASVLSKTYITTKNVNLKYKEGMSDHKDNGLSKHSPPSIVVCIVNSYNKPKPLKCYDRPYEYSMWKCRHSHDHLMYKSYGAVLIPDCNMDWRFVLVLAFGITSKLEINKHFPCCYVIILRNWQWNIFFVINYDIKISCEHYYPN